MLDLHESQSDINTAVDSAVKDITDIIIKQDAQRVKDKLTVAM